MAETRRERFRRRRRIWRKRGTNLALRLFLRAKAALGRYDRRYFNYYGVSDNVTDAVKRVVTRAYARGLVPTSTTGGSHAPGSYHYQRRAVDLGVRSHLVGTGTQTRKLKRFQRSEYNRDQRGKTTYLELIGPTNTLIILRGSNTTLAEGGSLENAHDNHVHAAL